MKAVALLLLITTIAVYSFTSQTSRFGRNLNKLSAEVDTRADKSQFPIDEFDNFAREHSVISR